MTRRVPVDASYVPAEDPVTEDAGNQAAEQTPADTQPGEAVQNESVSTDLEDDFEFKRLKAMYCLLKDSGYTLRLSQREETETPPPGGGVASISFPEAA